MSGAIQVALGFDCETDSDSWSPFYGGPVHGTPVILGVLAKHEITATFFFTTDSAKKYPEVVSQEKEAGHEIDCHTLCHETVDDARASGPTAGRPCRECDGAYSGECESPSHR